MDFGIPCRYGRLHVYREIASTGKLKHPAAVHRRRRGYDGGGIDSGRCGFDDLLPLDCPSKIVRILQREKQSEDKKVAYLAFPFLCRGFFSGGWVVVDGVLPVETLE